MRALVRQAMEDGAVGLSTSLQYAPAPYAKTEEIIATGLPRRRNTAASTPLTCAVRVTRSLTPSTNPPGSVREAHIPVEIWHLKAAGKANFGRMPQIVDRIQKRRVASGGLDISANTYAYTAWFNTFSAFIPPWAHDGGDDKLIARLKDP